MINKDIYIMVKSGTRGPLEYGISILRPAGAPDVFFGIPPTKDFSKTRFQLLWLLKYKETIHLWLL